MPTHPPIPPTPPRHPTLPPETLRVLVVDDAPGVAETLATLLQLKGFEVRTAVTGPDALAVAAHFDPHCVLLDLQLPLVDGTEVAEHLRANAWDATRLAIIATTGYPADYPRLGEAFDHRVEKPVDVDALCALVTRCCRERLGDGAFV